ncbi:Stf0 family sulfotransferase [Yoonia sp. BS5-3]|uniref:Stf0 family sulfotransferase n=1 Tax=Yoonia phaeophyticola TaxID=3137369 RepID=A0ABZ2V5B8_9RHOB
MILRPEQGYLICTMPRSGSTLLCDLLSQTGVAGKPNSFFRPQSLADFAAEWDVPAPSLDDFDQSYIDAALTHGSANTGCFGMRIMWQNNVPDFIQRLGVLFPAAQTDLDRLQAAFGPLKFIHLARRDLVAEAVSYVIADQSGLWHRNADGSELERTRPPAEPDYDFDAIHAIYEEVSVGHGNWNSWFDGQNITPLQVAYEDLAQDPNDQLRRVLHFLGCDERKADGIRPGTARLSDARNADWAARFREEAGLAPAAPGT